MSFCQSSITKIHATVQMSRPGRTLRPVIAARIVAMCWPPLFNADDNALEFVETSPADLGGDP